MLLLRVGNAVAAIVDVMGVIEILSSRKEYTKLNLNFICCIVGYTFKSDHQIKSSFGYVCAHVTPKCGNSNSNCA